MAKYFASFARAERGNVAIIFAFLLFVLFGSAALAIDVARGFSSRASMQQSLDAALLYAANEKARSGDSFDEQAGIRNYFNGLKRQNHVTGNVDVSITNENNAKFTGKAVATVLPKFAQVLGLGGFNVVVTSEARLTEEPLELALVLDNTSSMAGTKIDTLKKATKDLVTTLFNIPNAATDVRISIVPFADYVNVGLQYRNAPWLDVQPDNLTTTNVCNDVVDQVLVPGSCVDVTNTTLVDGQNVTNTTQQCQYTAGASHRVCQDVTTGTRWNGCVGSRPYPLNVDDANYLNSAKVPGIMDVTCPAALTPLTNNESTVTSALDGLVSTGDTYIPGGLIWGWATLSKQEPFGQSRDTLHGHKVKKYLVLMTDGFNTKSIGTNGKDHTGSDTGQANSYTTELCTNIKNAGIEVYTVAFEVTDSTVKNVLKSCVSDPNNYYEAKNTSDLVAAFEGISKDISPIHLTR